MTYVYRLRHQIRKPHGAPAPLPACLTMWERNGTKILWYIFNPRNLGHAAWEKSVHETHCIYLSRLTFVDLPWHLEDQPCPPCLTHLCDGSCGSLSFLMRRRHLDSQSTAWIWFGDVPDALYYMLDVRAWEIQPHEPPKSIGFDVQKIIRF